MINSEDTAFTISQGKIKVIANLDLITLEKCITKAWKVCEPAYGKLPWTVKKNKGFIGGRVLKMREGWEIDYFPEPQRDPEADEFVSLRH